MSNTAKRDSAEMQYLLGDLSEDEKARVEEAFFADDAKFEELELAEEELIDAYVRDRLSDKEQRQFNAKLMRSPRLVKRVDFARALAEKADSSFSLEAEDSIEREPVFIPPAPKPRRWWAGLFAQPAFRTAFATSAVLLLVGGGILFYGWLRLRSESERLDSERAELQRQREEFNKLSTEQRSNTEQLTADLSQAKDQIAKAQQRIEDLERAQRSKGSDQSILGPVVALVLNAPSVRSGGGGNEVKISANTSGVKLILPLETNDHPSYSVRIENIDKGAPIQIPRLKPQRTKSGRQLVFQIPARPGDYTVNVSGRTPSGKLEPVTNSEFRVIRE